MRMARSFPLMATLTVAFLAACGNAEAPHGRWEGFSASAKWLVAVRLQVDPGNVIKATALSVNVDGVSLSRRLELTRKIKSTLLEKWPYAVAAAIDYRNGRVTKAGGFAPLFVFDPRVGTMTFNFYADGRLSERIKLYPVRAFSNSALQED